MRNLDRELNLSKNFFIKESDKIKPTPYVVPEDYILPKFSLVPPGQKKRENFVLSNIPDNNNNIPLKNNSLLMKPSFSQKKDSQFKIEETKMFENKAKTTNFDNNFFPNPPKKTNTNLANNFSNYNNNQTNKTQNYTNNLPNNSYKNINQSNMSQNQSNAVDFTTNYNDFENNRNYMNTFSDNYSNNSLNANNFTYTPNINYSANNINTNNYNTQTNIIPSIKPIQSNFPRNSDINNSTFQEYKKILKNYEIADVIKWTLDKFLWDEQIDDLRKHIFGIAAFRQNQKAIVNATLSHKDVFVCMPTGGGKSLCFQLPALRDEGITLVIMPLISLIHDQVNQLKNLGIRAIGLVGSNQLSYIELKNMCLDRDDTKMIYATPEKIEKCAWFIEFLKVLYNNKKLKRIVIDEAHCVSHWGRDFRPDYLLLGKLKVNFPDIPTMALTATATEIVRKDIINNLGIKNCLYFQSSFNRPNLIYEVRMKQTDEKTVKNIYEFIQTFYPKKSGIIYCTTIKDAEKVAKLLQENHAVPAEAYHASLPEGVRQKVQDDWMMDETLVIVATIAFGMGINKPNVRFVIHFSLSKSIENYYQESGRAGRDGKPSHCVTYYRFGDRLNLYALMSHSANNFENRKGLLKMLQFCEDLYFCRREAQLAHFGEKFLREKCDKMCDNCILDRKYMEKDYSNEAKTIVEAFKFLPSNTYTYNKLFDLLSGIANKKNPASKDISIFGYLKKWNEDVREGFIKEIIFQEILIEKTVDVFGHSCTYLNYNQNYKKDIEIKVKSPKTDMSVEDNKTQSKKRKNKENTAEDNEYMLSSAITRHLQAYTFRKSEANKFLIKEKKELIPEKIELNSIYSDKNDNIPQKPTTKTCPKENILVSRKKSKRYDPDFGYCTEEQYEEILERLNLIRKQIYNAQKKIDKDINNIDNLFPLIGLEELSKKLPTNTQELNPDNIKNVGVIPLQQYGSLFLAEIEHFLKINNINKEDYLMSDNEDLENLQNAIFNIEENCLNETPHEILLDDENNNNNQSIQKIEEEFDDNLLNEIDSLINELKQG